MRPGRNCGVIVGIFITLIACVVAAIGLWYWQSNVVDSPPSDEPEPVVATTQIPFPLPRTPSESGPLTPPELRQPATADNALVDVSATAGWQDTGIVVAAGQSVVIEYESGAWNRCAGVFGCPDTGPEGPDVESENYADNTIMGCKHAALIARVGSDAFCVGRRFQGILDQSGEVELRINDRVLGDNQGSLKIRVAVR